ncbi:MAG: abortive infection family protein [Actinobacteria bacterium]|nr:abortive infection family protein [Actinomycetota bacterium]
MARARSDRDWELAIGSAKELAEAIAKMVLDARGEPFGNGSDFPWLINAAHLALHRQPGEDLANDPPMRAMAGSAKKIVLAVGEIRGSHGTGHGRTRTPDVVAEHAEVTADAALLWARWALRRLDVIVDGRVTDIVRDLRDKTFYKRDLARRLAAADIPSLDAAEQHRLGVVVGQRAARATINVLDEGLVDPTVVTWPEPYRAGAFEGAFIDPDGYILSTGAVTRAAIALLRSLESDAEAVVQRVAERAHDADFAYGFGLEDRTSVADVLADGAGNFEGLIAAALKEIADRIRP